MGRSSQVLTEYEQLAGTLAHMVALARDRQWEHLPALDARCCALFEHLAATPAEDLLPDEFARLLQLVSRIRGDQDALLRLVQPQFLQLRDTLQALPAGAAPS